jgi:hypothetical protein
LTERVENRSSIKHGYLIFDRKITLQRFLKPVRLLGHPSLELGVNVLYVGTLEILAHAGVDQIGCATADWMNVTVKGLSYVFNGCVI